ncbi:MAG: hypothetical protein ACI85O_003843 [Saprospiraceae bacterium]|jgi:hypothetical protein
MTKKAPSQDNSKLFQILRKFHPSQLTKLQKFIASPYFHQTTGVMDLFLHLRKFHPDYPLKKVSDEMLARQLFPNTKNGTKKVKNFKSDLIKLIEQFLIQQQFSEQESQQKFLLAHAYQDLQLPNYANNSIKKVNQSLEKSTTKGLTYLYQKMQLAHYVYYHPDTLKVFSNQQKLQELLKQLDQYFILAKYKYAYEAEERMAKQKEHFDLSFWEEVKSEASNLKGLEKQSPLYYYQELQRLSAQEGVNEKSFEQLKIDFFKNLEHLNLEDQQAIYKYLLNYILKALNSGAPQFIRLQLDLYKAGLSNNLLIWKNRITINSFLNVLVVALTCKAFDWANLFIATYKDYLNPNDHDEVMKITNALICFHQGQAKQALSIIGGAKFKLPTLELFSLLLEIKSMFEIYLQDQSYHATINSRLDSLAKQFSKKYDFSTKREKEYLEYVHFVKLLVKTLNRDKVSSKIKIIHSEITATKYLIHKSWLLEKCSQMMA